MPSQVTQQELAVLAYENAGREISQVFDGINSNTALAAGTVAALLAVLGAGELFTRPESQPATGLPKLSSVSLVVLAAALPVLWRFFIRSVTAYQNLLRFNQMQWEAWQFLTGERTWDSFRRHVEVYWLEWRSPKTMHGLMWDNLKYGFFAIFLVSAAALVWAFVTSSGVAPRLVAGSFIAVAVLWEATTLETHRRKFFRIPNGATLKELEELRCARPSTTENEEPSGEGFVEEARGMFFGLRRLKHP